MVQIEPDKSSDSEKRTEQRARRGRREGQTQRGPCNGERTSKENSTKCERTNRRRGGHGSMVR